MSGIFTRIIKGEIPSYKVAEDDDFYAFLDISPLAEGHTLVVPKVEIDYIFDLSDAEYQKLFLFAKRVARAIEKIIPCKKIGIAVVGLEVAHAHIHLVPLNSMADIDFGKVKLSLPAERLKEISEKIYQEFCRSGD
jgi:histidine triad (HIT) family protein